MRRKRSPLIEPLEDRLCMDSGAVPAMYPGSPILLPIVGPWTQTPFLGSPIFADLKGDGHQELIVEAAGGKMIAYYMTFGEYDFLVVSEGPSLDTAAAASIVAAAGGGVTDLKTTVGMTSAEMKNTFTKAGSIAAGFRSAGAKG